MQKQLLFLSLILMLFSCEMENKEKIPVYAWLAGPGEASDTEIQTQFEDLKEKGIDGLMYNGGQDPAVYSRVGKIAKNVGLE